MPADRRLSLFRTMARIRAFENAAEEASKAGSMHIADFSVGMLGANGVWVLLCSMRELIDLSVGFALTGGAAAR